MSEAVAVPLKSPDAGTRDIDHYKVRLPKWRYRLRNALVSVVRSETPALARMQQEWRTPALDVYFASAANLGTHTFFTIILPVAFWCGQSTFGRAMINVLAGGVFLSGFLKDLLCLPRPMSPPLQRISKSTSAALEYGFPSTHATNAVSVAVYSIYALHTSSQDYTPAVFAVLHVIFFVYIVSIIYGRLYCGMHGYLDVIIGSLLGLAIAAVQCTFGAAFDSWIINGSFQNSMIAILITLVLVRIHPEPVDDCPCFDDSVAFSGVFIGSQLASWHFARTPFAWDSPARGTVPFDIDRLGWPKVVARIFVGIFMVFAWRGIMKPTLLRLLPPLFRLIERLGLLLPRRYFLSASQYEHVPPLRKDDNVIPPASEIPSMLKSLRHPRQRTVSIGPQSEADAYEAIAYRERRRRESISPSGHRIRPSFGSSILTTDDTDASMLTDISKSRSSALEIPSPGFQKSPLGTFNADEDVLMTPSVLESPATEAFPPFEPTSEEGDEQADARMFLALLKPRVRYDVEVVTKLIIYAGIAILVLDVVPIFLQQTSLGVF